MSETIEAGRACDALIAEKLFGAQGIGYYGPTKSHGAHLDQVKVATWAEAKALYDKYWPAATVHDHVHEDIYQWKEGWGPLYIPEYSTERCDALLVVDRLTERGIGLTIVIDSGGVHVAVFKKQGVVRRIGEADADSLALAICRASLAPRVLAALSDGASEQPALSSGPGEERGA